ncbi:MAG: DNA-nicking Smr family endonuclease [Paracoccaceae bacterium]|jgi:DNA-nicking Smr family endonuclease
MARKSGKRDLTEDEQALWHRAVEKTTRLKVPLAAFAQVLESPQNRPLPSPDLLRPFQIGQIANAPKVLKRLTPDLGMNNAPTSPNMDKRNFDRLKKGKLAVDGKIDLHGMTLAQAHPALNGFIRAAHGSGKRLLLVITGKGKIVDDSDGFMPTRRGILKQQVPQWLAMAPLAPMILQVTQATQKHGGGGAFYVYLRRQR